MADTPTILYVVRHGESESNRNKTVGGHFDAPLTDTGRLQARQAQQALHKVHFDVAYSSDLQRAVETGEIIFGKPIPPSHQWKGLRERDYGSLTGKSAAHQQTIHEIVLTMPDAEIPHYKYVPDMESDHEVSTRFINELTKVAEANLGKTILVAGHSAAIRTTLMQLQSVGYRAFPSGSFKNAGYVKLLFSDGHFIVQEIAS
jgi:uncharacterized phosphatase